MSADRDALQALQRLAPSIPQESADAAWMALWGARTPDYAHYAAPPGCGCRRCGADPCLSIPFIYAPDLPGLPGPSAGPAAGPAGPAARFFAFRRPPCVGCGPACSASSAQSGLVWVFDTHTARWDASALHGLWYSRKAGVCGREGRRPASFC